MTRHAAVFAALALTFVLSKPAFSQDAAAADGAEKCVGGPAGSKCGRSAAHDALDLRVQFDKEDAKGEIKCKKGKLLGKKVKYSKCLHDKMDGYEEMAEKKRFIKKKPVQLNKKKRKLAKKLAFYDSARKELKSKLAAMKDSKEDMEYKKAEGALESVDKEFDKCLAECSKQDASEFSCPAKD